MAYLLVYENGALREQIELDRDRLTIGRATDNDVVLADKAVSGHHAIIEKKGTSFVLHDDKSSNGVFVDGNRIERHPLKYWEEIKIAKYLLKFRPRARLPGEREGELEMPDEVQESAQTTEINVAGIREVIQRRNQRQAQTPKLRYLLEDVRNGMTRYHLDKGELSIGKGEACDIRTRGWFAPRVAANIRRHSDGFYVFPSPRSKTHVNGNKISQPTQLRSGDCLAVRDVVLIFNKADTAA